MKGVILDADSLGPGDVDLSPITSSLDAWQVFPSVDPADIVTAIGKADVVLSNKISLSHDTLNAAPNLKFVSVMATGVNNVDLNAARKLGIPVSNAVGYATPSVVQHTISLMLALSNNLVAYVEDVRNGAWQESAVFCLLARPINELAGKRLGIVGHGELGSNVGRVAAAFGMDVVVSQRPGSSGVPAGRMAFDEVLATSDYISLHCPLTPDNADLINANTLAAMKSTACLVNTARGGLVNSRDLLDALTSGRLGGAGIDVLRVEPPGAEPEPLLDAKLPNLLVTPHNAWGARESRQRLVVQMRENIDAWLEGKPLRRVN